MQIGSRRYALNGTPTANGNSFDVSLKTVPLPPGGATTTTVTFRLCTTASCSTVYPGSTQTFTVNLDVRLKDWATFQRDAAHTGYVAVNYNTADFTNAWSLASTSPPTEIAARRGSIFVNVRQPDGNLFTRALDPANGNILWTYDLGAINYFSGPSYANGRVASMAMNISSGSIPMQIISADDGSALGVISYASQFSNGGVPTPSATICISRPGITATLSMPRTRPTGAGSGRQTPLSRVKGMFRRERASRRMRIMSTSSAAATFSR